MYSRLLLFFPLKSEAELNENNLTEMYTRLSDDQDDTIVNYNERKLFPMKIQNPSPLIFDEEEDGTDYQVETLDDLSDAIEGDEGAEDITDQVEAGERALDALLDALEEETDDVDAGARALDALLDALEEEIDDVDS